VVDTFANFGVIEQDDRGSFIWLTPESEIPEQLGHEVFLEVTEELKDRRVRVGSGEDLELHAGLNFFPLESGDRKLFFRGHFSPQNDARQLTARLRLFEHNKKDFEVSYHPSGSSGELETRIRFNGPFVRGWVDLVVQGPSGKNISIRAGSEQSSFELQNKKISISFFAGVDFCQSVEISAPVMVMDLRVRENYFDYFGDEKTSDNEPALKASTEAAQHIPLFVQWFVTWKCNYKCHYCWQEANPEFYRNAPITRVPAMKWAGAFNRLKPKFLYLTGGEPTLYKHLPEMLSLIDDQTHLIMTTNLGFDLDLEKFVNLVAPSKFSELMVSYHPTQVGQEDFSRRIRALVKAGFDTLGIEMVLNPSNLSEIPFLNRLVADCGIKVRYDDFHPVSGLYVASESAQQAQEKAKDFAEKHNSKVTQRTLAIFSDTVDFDAKKLISPKKGQAIYCPAGQRKINVDGLGDVYACMSAIDRSRLFGPTSMPHYSKLGNVLDGSFDWFHRPIICHEAFRCSACDYQVLDKAWHPLLKHIEVPIPE